MRDSHGDSDSLGDTHKQMYPPYNVNWKGEDTEAADSDEELRYWQITHKTMRSNEHNMLQETFLLKIVLIKNYSPKIIHMKRMVLQQNTKTVKVMKKMYYNFF